MKIAASFLLVVGCFWALFVIWLFLTIAGIADGPTSVTALVLYWGGMLIGPFSLIIGAVLLLRGTSLRPALILLGIGCVILTAYTLYNSVIGLHREPLQAPPPYLFYVVMLLIMALSDAAAYRVYRALTHGEPNPQGEQQQLQERKRRW
jgi:hypothetical protein